MNAVSTIKIMRAGEGDSCWAMGEKFTFKIGPEDTGGAFSLAEVAAQPRNGPPPHLHRREDELFYVVDGEFTFSLRDSAFDRSTGYAAFLPRNVVHTYTNSGEAPGKLLVLATPCGFEEFIRAWSYPIIDATEAAPTPTSEDVAKLTAIAPSFGIEFHPETKLSHDHTRPIQNSSRWVLGQFVTTKLSSKETAGKFSVVEVISPPGTGIPNHVHVAMDELFYVLDGAVDFTFVDHSERLETGDLLFVPRGEVHGFRNAGKTPCRLFDLHTPGGFEAFFEEAGVPAMDYVTPPPAAPKPDFDYLLSLFRKHGMKIPV